MKNLGLNVFVFVVGVIAALASGYGFVAIAGRGELLGAVLPLAFLYCSLRAIEFVIVDTIKSWQQFKTAH